MATKTRISRSFSLVSKAREAIKHLEALDFRVLVTAGGTWDTGDDLIFLSGFQITKATLEKSGIGAVLELRDEGSFRATPHPHGYNPGFVYLRAESDKWDRT